MGHFPNARQPRDFTFPTYPWQFHQQHISAQSAVNTPAPYLCTCLYQHYLKCLVSAVHPNHTRDWHDDGRWTDTFLIISLYVSTEYKAKAEHRPVASQSYRLDLFLFAAVELPGVYYHDVLCALLPTQPGSLSCWASVARYKTQRDGSFRSLPACQLTDIEPDAFQSNPVQPVL